MSKACYLGTPKNASTKTKKMYFSNNGLTVKVKKGYVSSGNKARLFLDELNEGRWFKFRQGARQYAHRIVQCN